MSLGFNFLNMLGLGGTSCGTGNTLGQLFSGTNSIFGCGYNNYNYVSCGSRGRNSASHGIGQYIGMALAGLGMNLLAGIAGKFLDNLFKESDAKEKTGTQKEQLEKLKTDLNTKQTGLMDQKKANLASIQTLETNLAGLKSDSDTKQKTYEALNKNKTTLETEKATLEALPQDQRPADYAAKYKIVTDALAAIESAKKASDAAKTKYEQQKPIVEKQIAELKAENSEIDKQLAPIEKQILEVTNKLANLDDNNSLKTTMSEDLYASLFNSTDNNLIEVEGVQYEKAYKTAMLKLAKAETDADKVKYAKQLTQLYEKMGPDARINTTYKSYNETAKEILARLKPQNNNK